jgi:hypothetical protein
MTESEWLDERQAQTLLSFLLEPGRLQRTRIGKRKLRLFSCGCCRLIWDGVESKHLRSALEAAEQFADAGGGPSELERASELVGYAMAVLPSPDFRYQQAASILVGYSIHPSASTAAVSSAMFHLPAIGSLTNERFPRRLQCSLVRDIFGNPFRPMAIDTEWKTSTVVSLAKSMYESRDFSMMPVLSDALQDAGCESAEMLSHCRGSRPHVRGCWVVDGVLSRE